MNHKRIAVIGGGAAGLMAAIAAAESGGQVTLLEPNERLGKKLNITGKGRCNVTNNCSREELLRNIPFEDMVFAGENALDLRTLVRDQSAEAALAAHEMGAADAPSRMIGFIPEQTGLVKRTIGFLLFDRETFRKKLRKRMHRSPK